ncbi:spore maturation protein CgeB [Marininema mesophilum]|uniref:Spore maturation protein CgeB n=1 Tax=Marininema mesophilum TaxID=1048340 RepID=A0A1H2ZHV0_9BACL|nr:glycosyltransferase [Marininema mesophilum]SDX16976.1 spore maturation protein CgeB [Marininema mesophilum]
MKAIYVPSSIRKPFAFIDDCIKKTMDKIGIRTRVLSPGKGFVQGLDLSIRDFQPDFLLANLGCRLDNQELDAIQSLTIPTGIWYTDDPYAMDQSLMTCRSFQYIFTNEEAAVSVYQAAGCLKVYHLPLATSIAPFSPRRVSSRYQSDVLILGTAFDNRLEEVDYLASHLPAYRLKIIGPGWGRLKNYRRLKGYIRGEWVGPNEAACYYAGAKIVLNIHRSADDPYLRQNQRGISAWTPNNRLFEIASCRAYQLMSYRPGVTSLFPDGEIDTYQEREELPERLKELLNQGERREDLASRAHLVTLEQHRYVHRIKRILATLELSL